MTTKKQREKANKKKLEKQALEPKTRFVTLYVEKTDLSHLDIEELEDNKEIDKRIKEQQEKELSLAKGEELDSIVVSVPDILVVRLQKTYDAYVDAQQDLRDLILEHELKNSPKTMINKRDMSWLHR